jgi:hypothetical protein
MPIHVHEIICKAAYQGEINVLRFCVTNSALANAHSKEGKSALTYAAFNGHLECAELLLTHGADIHAVPFNFASRLICEAASQGNLPFLRLSVINKQFANARFPIEQLTDNKTALMHAVINGHVDCAAHLLIQGADTNAVEIQKDPHSKTAVDFAIEQSRAKMLTLLLASGAKWKAMEQSTARDFMLLLQDLAEDLIEPILSLCSDGVLNSQYKDQENLVVTLLWDAAHQKNWPLVRAILKRNPQDLNIQPTRATNSPPWLPAIHYALVDDAIDIAKEMLIQGATLNYIDYNSSCVMSGLMYAAKHTNLPAELVLSRVSDSILHHKDATRSTHPLHSHWPLPARNKSALDYAAEYKNWALVKAIRERIHLNDSQHTPPLSIDERHALDLALKNQAWDVVFALIPRHAQRIKDTKLVDSQNKPTGLKQLFEIFSIISQHYAIETFLLHEDNPEWLWDYFSNTDEKITEAFFKKLIYLNEIRFGNVCPRSGYIHTLMPTSIVRYWAIAQNKEQPQIKLVMQRVEKWKEVIHEVGERNKLWNWVGDKALPSADSDNDKFIAEAKKFINVDERQGFIDDKFEFFCSVANFCESGLQKPKLAKQLYELVTQEIEAYKAKEFDTLNRTQAIAQRGLAYLAVSSLGGELKEEDSQDHYKAFLRHAILGTVTPDDEIKNDSANKAAKACELMKLQRSSQELHFTIDNFVNHIMEATPTSLQELKRYSDVGVQTEVVTAQEESRASPMMMQFFDPKKSKRVHDDEIKQEIKAENGETMKQETQARDDEAIPQEKKLRLR